MNYTDGVPFDPGYSKFVSSFMYFNSEVEQMLRCLKTPQQKAFKYRQFHKQVLDIMAQEVGFYYGCLLWASFIKYKYEKNPQVILNNSFYGKSQKQLDEYDYLHEINYLINFFEKYPQTMKYFGINAAPIDKKYTDTTDIYKEFLILNKSFIETKTTADLVLPSRIKKLEEKDLDIIEKIIEKAITDGEFESLFSANLF